MGSISTSITTSHERRNFMTNSTNDQVQVNDRENPIIETKIDMVGEGNWFRVREIKTYFA